MAEFYYSTGLVCSSLSWTAVWNLPCPTCGVEAKVYCVSLKKRYPQQQAHKARRQAMYDMAKAAFTEQCETGACEFQTLASWEREL